AVARCLWRRASRGTRQLAHAPHFDQRQAECLEELDDAWIDRRCAGGCQRALIESDLPQHHLADNGGSLRSLGRLRGHRLSLLLQPHYLATDLDCLLDRLAARSIGLG